MVSVKIWGSVVIWVQTTINQKNTHNGARVARADHTVQKKDKISHLQRKHWTILLTNHFKLNKNGNCELI